MTRCTPPMSKPKNSRQNLRCCRPDGTRLARSVAVLEQRQRVLTSRRRQAVHLLDEIAAAGRPGARDLLALLWIDHVVILDKQRLRTGPSHGVNHCVERRYCQNSPLIECAALW